MFLIKIPEGYTAVDQVEEPFKELSLAYDLEFTNEYSAPCVIEGKKQYKGLDEIQQLMDELQGYYGLNYNCSCAR